MPTISIFFGIKVTINFNEYKPPHFHAEYNGEKIAINIQASEVLTGYLPKKQLRLVLAWNEIYKDELMQNWELAREGGDLIKIEGLR